jgi:diguanylate cyclase (GGDEF)-like protein
MADSGRCCQHVPRSDRHVRPARTAAVSAPAQKMFATGNVVSAAGRPRARIRRPGNGPAVGTIIDREPRARRRVSRGENDSMNANDIELPLGVVAVQAAAAGLAALGLVSLVPVAPTAGALLLIVPVLGLVAAGGLVHGGKQVVARARRAAARDALKDPLTGLAARDSAEQTLAAEFAAAERGRPLTVVLFRIAQFPRFRGRHGRPVADRVLRGTGGALNRHTRHMHTTGVHGPHEGCYISVLSGVSVDGACVFAKRVHRDIAALPGMPERLVVSASVVPYDASMESAAQLVATAQRALAKAEASGGRIVVVGQIGGPTTTE